MCRTIVVASGGVHCSRGDGARPDREGQTGGSTSPFLGSAPKAAVSPTPIALSVKDAVSGRSVQPRAALAGRSRQERTRRALARAGQPAAGHLGRVQRPARQIINLEAYGFQADPSIIGPFNVFDARVYASQPVLRSPRRERSARGVGQRTRADARRADGPRSRDAGGGQPVPRGGRRREPHRGRPRAAGHRGRAVPAGQRHEAGWRRRRHRRAARAGAAPESASADDSGGERVREIEAAARARDRAAGRRSRSR